MPKVNVHRTITIDASAAKIHTYLSDFNHWTAWSPWLIQDPDAKVEVASDAQFYAWEGARVGSGNMKITKQSATQLEYDLNFLKPWKSFANIVFDLKENEGKTDVTWHMATSLPFFMFWMKKSMEAYIGMDFGRGLNLLKDYVEKGQVESNLDFVGYEHFDGCAYIGVKTATTMSEMGNTMPANFKLLQTFLSNNKEVQVVGNPFTIYHKWDAVKQGVEFTAGIPVQEISGAVPTEIITGQLPKTQVYSIVHKGAYKHLGNAWSTLYNLQRIKEIKVNKKVHPFEIYENEPGTVPENEMLTRVCFPVK